MIKRTLYFGNPAYLSLNNKQLLIRLPEVEKNENLEEQFKKEAVATVPVEDIGVVILDNSRITITQALMAALIGNNVALISCSETHMPAGLMLPLDVHNIQHERFTAQIGSSVPLRKKLWQQTVVSKIANQAGLLKKNGKDPEKLLYWAKNVRSGDPDNNEGKAAHYYWSHLFPESLMFSRDRDGEPPNNLLNYGYAILRAIIARNLVGSGLLPTFGIQHRNKYNAYCLADDIMEPYRPYVDELVLFIVNSGSSYDELTTDLKKELLGIATVDVMIEEERSPLMVAAQRTTASLAKCFEGSGRKIVYPKIE
ncbi:MAG: type II CRISPR-associated endonuclease Cas1 [Bacteroidia bacterium]|nr:type II CRISPR-associated endonuclease Cas1 [Bacteroidia bacterium]